MVNRLVKISLYLITGYLILVVGLYLFQDSLIFQADPLSQDYKFEFDEEYTEFTIVPKVGEEINALIFSLNNAERKGTVLYFHGNADNMQRWGEYAVDFTSLGYAVLMIDYSGYGKSSGKPSEETLYKDAEATWLWAQNHLPGQDFIVYGRSLGTAVASRLAVMHKPKQLILETPFDQLAQSRLSIFFPFGLHSKFSNYENLQDVSCPVTIIQGNNDWIVSYKSAEKLIPLLNNEDDFILIEGGGHKNLREFTEYQKALARILE